MGDQTDIYGNPVYTTTDGRHWGVSGSGDTTQVDPWGMPVTPQPDDRPQHLPISQDN